MGMKHSSRCMALRRKMAESDSSEVSGHLLPLHYDHHHHQWSVRTRERASSLRKLHLVSPNKCSLPSCLHCVSLPPALFTVRSDQREEQQTREGQKPMVGLSGNRILCERSCTQLGLGALQGAAATSQETRRRPERNSVSVHNASITPEETSWGPRRVEDNFLSSR